MTGKLIRAYYLATPLFVVLDALFGITFRASGLTLAEYRYLYYGFCLLCALGCFLQVRYSALIAIAESSVNLLILLLGIMLPVIQLGDLPGEADAAILINSDNILNFMITGIVLVCVFHAAQRELQDPASIDNQRR
jgi:fumarate reductase subunit D